MRAFSASIPALAGLLLATTAPAALAAGRTELVSLGRGGVLDDRGSESTPSVSGDGRYVAFLSYGTDLVPGDTNNVIDIFVRDRKLGTTKRVSVATGGAQADSESFDPWITPDGRYVAFDSSATNLVPGDTN